MNMGLLMGGLALWFVLAFALELMAPKAPRFILFASQFVILIAILFGVCLAG